MAAVDEQMSYTPELFLSRECEPHLPASLVDLSAHAQYVKVHLLPKKVLLKITIIITSSRVYFTTRHEVLHQFSQEEQSAKVAI